jgi:syntaxin 5
MESHSQTVILNLQQQLASMSSDFRNTLEIRSQTNQQQKARREKYSSPAADSLMARSQSNAIIDFGDSSAAISPSSGGFSNSRVQQQQQLLAFEDNSVQYLEERANAMQSVESTIVELGTIFNQLATMVQQQEEMITRIDTNVTDAAMNVESAHQSLLQYFQSVSNNRWLILKVFGILFLFFVLFVALA